MYNSRKRFRKKKPQSVVKNNYSDPYWYQDIEDSYIKAIQKRAELDEEISNIRMQLSCAMEDEDLRRIRTNKTDVIVVRSYDLRIVDSSKLKNLYPEIFEECSNAYKMPSHLQIKIKK